jgi:RNA polymerase sigma factor (sigma-70 family)
MLAVRRGEGAAFAEIVERYQRLVRWRLALLVPADMVDDLAQEVFVRLAEACRDPATPLIQSMAGWLVVVARREAANYFRQVQRRESLLQKYLGRFFGDPTGDGLVQTTRWVGPQPSAHLEALEECLQMLQPKYREVVDGYYLQGQSAELLAVQTARTPAAIRMILMRIRRSLGKCIQSRLKRPDAGAK